MTLTDTVGFIQKLPHNLVDAFKSTLSEVLSADLILKVVDASDEDWQRHLRAVERVLADIGANERPALTVFNKVDLLEEEDRRGLAASNPGAVLFSAATGYGITELQERLAREAASSDRLMSVLVPYREAALVKVVHEQCQVLQESYEGEGTRLTLRAPQRLAARLTRFELDH